MRGFCRLDFQLIHLIPPALSKLKIIADANKNVTSMLQTICRAVLSTIHDYTIDRHCSHEA